MYDKLNDSPETEDEKKIGYFHKRKAKSTKKPTDKPTKLKKLDCNRCGAPNWSRQHKCPAREKKCAKCEQIGQYAKGYRTNKRVNRIQEHETSRAEEVDWSPNTIHCVNQKIHSTSQMRKAGPDFFTLTALVYNRPIKFIIDQWITVISIPQSQFNGITPLKPLETEYRDVNDNQISCEGKTTATVEIDGKRNNLEILVTTKKTNRSLGLDWTSSDEKLGITLDTSKTGPQKNHVTEDPDITTPKRKFKKLFHENHTVKRLEVKKTERGCKIDTAKRKTDTNSSTTIGWKRNEQVIETGAFWKSK